MSTFAVLSAGRPSAIDEDGWEFAEDRPTSATNSKAWVSFAGSFGSNRDSDNAVVVAIRGRLGRGLRSDDRNLMHGFSGEQSSDPQLDKDMSEAVASDLEDFE